MIDRRDLETQVRVEAAVNVFRTRHVSTVTQRDLVIMTCKFYPKGSILSGRAFNGAIRKLEETGILSNKRKLRTDDPDIRMRRTVITTMYDISA